MLILSVSPLSNLLPSSLSLSNSSFSIIYRIFLNFFYFYTYVLCFIEAAQQERIQFAHNIMLSQFCLLSLFSSHYIIYQICHFFFSLSLSLFFVLVLLFIFLFASCCVFVCVYVSFLFFFLSRFCSCSCVFETLCKKKKKSVWVLFQVKKKVAEILKKKQITWVVVCEDR